MSLQDRLLRATRSRVVGRAAYLALKALGVEFPRSVEWNGPVELAHGAVGLVVHRSTRIGRQVILMPGVVIGRADSWIPPERVAHLGGRVVIGDEVTVGAGAKVLYSSGQELVVAEGTIVGANAVLRESTGPYEIWAGIPARRVGLRESDDTHRREGKGVVR
jgi:serine O-acetyltransferase